MRTCPSRDDLRRLLAEELTGSEVTAVQKHVDGCPSCQECLEALSTPAADLSPLPGSGKSHRLSKDAPPRDASLAPRQEFLDRLMAQGLSHSSGPSTADPACQATEVAWPMLPGYEILGVLGQGGMGLVYRARHVRLNRVVALKMIAVNATPEQRVRLHREAEAAARLQHPHIVQVYEVGEHEGRPYLTLELVEGGSLGQKLQGTPQPARSAAELLLILSQAMHYAHQQGIVHRDLKPANILLQIVDCRLQDAVSQSAICNLQSAIPKISDFGLAKQLNADSLQTQSGIIVGTPTYMAPEQAAGNARAIGPAADIYALGVILYELLTGRPPFQGETPLETLQQVVSVEPVSPSRLRPKLARDLQTICLKCLEKEPHKRYASAAALAEDLRRFLADEPIRARSVSQHERLWRWCRRNPRLAFLTAAVAVLLLVLAGGSSLAALWLGAERDRAVRAEQDVTDRLWQSYLAQARTGRLTGQAGQRFEGVRAIERARDLLGIDKLSADQSLELGNEAIACLATPDLRELPLPGVPDKLNFVALAFDRELEHYAIVEPHGEVVLRRLHDDKEIGRFAAPPGVPFRSEARVLLRSDTRVRFSPDARFLQVQYAHEGANNASCLVWDLQTGHKVLQTEILGCDFHPHRPVFAARTTDGKIRLYELPHGNQIRCLNPSNLALLGIRFDPGGRRLACMGNGSVQIVDVESAKVEVEFSEGSSNGEPLDWSPDGRWLAVPADHRRIQIYDTVERRFHSLLEGHESNLERVAFSPVGNLLASYGLDGRTRLWDPLSGKLWVSISGEFLRFSADGQRLAFTEISHIGIWEVAGEAVCRTLHHGPRGNRTSNRENGPYGVDFSGDGRILASASSDGVRLWDTATFGEIAHLAIGATQSIMFDPRGGGFATHGLPGVHYWPMQHLPEQAGIWRVGPPRILHPAGTWKSDARVAWDRNGHFLAFTDAPRHRLLVLPMDGQSKAISLADPDRGGRISGIALSPDGKWAAGTARKDARVKIWEVATGKAKYLPGLGPHDVTARTAFSPDGRWLIAASLAGYQWWRVDSWEQGPTVRKEQMVPCWPALAFSRNGALLAVVRAQHEVQLLDPASRREFATLIAPDRHMIVWLAFNHDGTLLAAATPDQVIQLWDLRLLRAELTKLSLDWDVPRYSPPAGIAVPAPLKVTVVVGTLGKSGVNNRGDIEAEYLPVVAAVDCQYARQPMEAWNGTRWSNGEQLFCYAGKGGYVDLDILVNGTPGDRHRLDICFTRAPDYGMVQVSLDGKKLGEIFDGFDEEVVPSGKIPFGELELGKGHHRLRFAVIDKNPRSTNYFMGIDCLDLKPVQ